VTAPAVPRPFARRRPPGWCALTSVVLEQIAVRRRHPDERACDAERRIPATVAAIAADQSLMQALAEPSHGRCRRGALRAGAIDGGGARAR
jgi:hypothetical protein